jgi:hypothetical protein
MSIFNRNQSKYPVSDAQAKERMRNGLKGLAYGVIGLMALITGVHAVMIVLSETAAFTLAGQTGLLLLLFTALRVGFPLVTELAAVIHTVGAVNGAWKGDQKTWGGIIDGVWLLFAAANMTTFFAIERGMALQNWQIYWLQYGLPLSGILSGVAVTKMILADPSHKRAEETAAAEEEKVGNEHAAKTAVEQSSAMYVVQVRRAWRDYVRELEASGYDEDEIAFMLANVPELRSISAPQPRQEQRGITARARGAYNDVRAAMSNPTHNAPRHDPTVIPLTEQPAAGQGQGNGAPPPVIGGRPEDFR